MASWCTRSGRSDQQKTPNIQHRTSKSEVQPASLRMKLWLGRHGCHHRGGSRSVIGDPSTVIGGERRRLSLGGGEANPSSTSGRDGDPTPERRQKADRHLEPEAIVFFVCSNPEPHDNIPFTQPNCSVAIPDPNDADTIAPFFKVKRRVIWVAFPKRVLFACKFLHRRR